MKLGYLVPEFPSQTHAFFWREILVLREMGHQVELLSTRRPDAGACRHDFAAQAAAETHYLYPPSRSALRALPDASRGIRSVVQYLAGMTAIRSLERARHLGLLACALELHARCLERGIEHVHVHSAADAAHVVALSHLIGGVPYSITLHGDLPVYGRDHALKFKRASFVATVTRPLKGQVEKEAHVPPERVKVLWMGVDTTRFTPLDTGTEAGPLRVATVARLNVNKGHRFALQALRRLLDAGVMATYTIAGTGEAHDDILAVVRSLALQDVVSFSGTLSEDEVLTLLRTTDVFVLPSVALGEAAPVSVMEAMACARVVVASRIGGTPDLIDHESDGFLTEQGDVDGIFRTLRRIADDPSLRQTVGRAARTKAVRLFDCRVTAAALVKAIQASASPARPDVAASVVTTGSPPSSG